MNLEQEWRIFHSDPLSRIISLICLIIKKCRHRLVFFSFVLRVKLFNSFPIHKIHKLFCDQSRFQRISNGKWISGHHYCLSFNANNLPRLLNINNIIRKILYIFSLWWSRVVSLFYFCSQRFLRFAMIITLDF